MKKVFKAVWRGIKTVFSTVVDWMCKLFGMSPETIPENLDEKEAKQRKEDAKYFRGLRLIVGSGFAVIVAFWAFVFVVQFVEEVVDLVDDMIETDKEELRFAYIEDELSDNLYYYQKSYSSSGFLADGKEKIILRDVVWIAKPMEGDSLVCYSDGNKRGYFHIRDGRQVVKPTYKHAWIFSEGLAAVEDKGNVKFIDTDGRVVVDRGFIYDETNDGYVFHKGHCAVNDNTGKSMGLIDHNGDWVLLPVYSKIVAVDTFWLVTKDNKQAILTFGIDTVIPMTTASFVIDDTNILATFNDHTQSLYNLKGQMITASQIRDVNQMLYETHEVMYPVNKDGIECSDEYYSYGNPAQRRAVATCMIYEAECGWYGLMSPDGKLITPPSFVSIEAIGKDLYFCETEYGRGIILNSRGKRVE